MIVPSNVKVIWNQAFYGCNGLKNITISEGVERLGAVFSRIVQVLNLSQFRVLLLQSAVIVLMDAQNLRQSTSTKTEIP